MNQNTENTFGTTLKVLRVKNHYTQEEVAGQIHVSRQAVSKWEQDKALPDFAKLVELSKLYHVKLEFLIQLLDIKREISPEVSNDSPEISEEYIFKIPKNLGRTLLTMFLATIVALSSAIPVLGLFLCGSSFYLSRRWHINTWWLNVIIVICVLFDLYSIYVFLSHWFFDFSYGTVTPIN